MSHFDFELPVVSIALRLTTRIPRRWLVYQLRSKGAHEELIYARVFRREASAKHAQQSRNARIASVGSVSLGTTRWAQVVRLPFQP
jgi:hypothetical protein